MWRLISKQDAERGASGVLVAVMMVVLIGAGALAVDAGQIYAERAQLQNGADGAAMAVAQVCHQSACSQAQANGIAAELLNANANDGSSTLSGSVEMGASQWTVRTTTRDGVSGAGFLSQMFASALNAPPATVGAYATAGAEPLGSASGFPLALSNECFNLTTASDTATVQKFSYKPGPSGTKSDVTCTGPSGTVIPGGWGWLDQSSPCEASSVLGSDKFGSDPGNNPPNQCSEVLKGWIGVINDGRDVLVPFPVFDNASGTGQGATFTIIGYATFKVWGWYFGGNHEYEFRNLATDPGMTPSLACKAPQRCIIGQFVKYETIDSTSGGPTGGANLGTVQIRLIQ